MRRLPTYRLRADRIPLSRHKLFLGRGFRWNQRHTQRLRDTIRPEGQHYVQPGPLYQWARRKEVAWESVPVLNVFAWLLTPMVEPAQTLAGGRRRHAGVACR